MFALSGKFPCDLTPAKENRCDCDLRFRYAQAQPFLALELRVEKFTDISLRLIWTKIQNAP